MYVAKNQVPGPQRSFAEEIYAITLYLKRHHPNINFLQPCAPLSEIQRHILPEFASLRLLAEYFVPLLPVFFAFFGGDKLNGEKNVKERDMEVRAHALADHIVAHPTVRRLVTMDGHGRFLLSFLREMMARDPARLDTLTIELVDMNREVTEWHESTYRCPALRSRIGNVLDIPDVLDSTVVYYLNFCGMTEQWQQVRAFLMATQHMAVFCSFSLMRGARRSMAGKFSHLGRFSEVVESPREDFQTRFLPPMPAPMAVARALPPMPAPMAAAVAVARAPVVMVQPIPPQIPQVMVFFSPSSKKYHKKTNMCWIAG